MRAGELYHALTTPGFLGCFYDVEAVPPRDLLARGQEHRRLARILKRAHKFEARYGGLIDSEDLHQTAVEFFRSGALRMPFAECYFEFANAVQDSPRSILAAILVDSGPARLEAHPFLWREKEGRWVDYGTTMYSDKMRQPQEGILTPFDFAHYPDGFESFIAQNSLRALQYSISLALFMSTKHATAERVAGPSPAAAKKREDAGRAALFEHHVVTIAPADRIRADLGGTHASPRLHWRRGHLRNLQSGRPVAVKPALVGLADKGFVSKDYAVPPPDKKRKDET